MPLWEAELLAVRLELVEKAAQAQETDRLRMAPARAEETLRLQRAKLVNRLSALERGGRPRRFGAAFYQTGDRSPEALTWLEWTHRQVQWLDPICSNPR